MARETRPVPFEEFSNNIANFFERVVHGHEIVLVEKEKGEIVEMKLTKPAKLASRSKRGSSGKRTEADHEAFLSSFGGWSDVDDEAFIKRVYESRNMPSRPPVEL